MRSSRPRAIGVQLCRLAGTVQTPPGIDEMLGAPACEFQSRPFERRGISGEWSTYFHVSTSPVSVSIFP